MKRIRIGKDISMRWEITTDGVAIPLEGRDLTIEIKSPAGIENNIPYRLEGNILIMTYYGYEQKRTGEYSITLWEKKGKPGQNVVDVISAFELVRTSQEENDFVGGDLQIESVDLGTENFDILTEGGYRAINIDTLQAESLKDSVNINGKTYSNESFTITLPKANLDSAGVMSASDARTLKEHADSIAQIKTSCEENAADIERVSNVVDTHESRLGGIDAEISSLNTEVSAMQSKVEENTTSISQINNNIADNNKSIAQINTTLEEHTESINAKITTERIEYGAVTSEKIATSAFDSTLSVSGKIAPADVVGLRIAEVTNRQITPEMLSESTKQYIEASGGGTITNLPDDEDITSVDNLLKFANKDYSPASYSGLGRVYLRKNFVDGKNVLTQDMISNENTIYIIQYDFDLNGTTITIPENCVLDFQGGSFSNGSIVGSNTAICAGNLQIFSNIINDGSWNVTECYLEWYGAKGDGINDDTNALRKAFRLFELSKGNSILRSKGKTYLITNYLRLKELQNRVIDFCGAVIKVTDYSNFEKYTIDKISYANTVLAIDNCTNCIISNLSIDSVTNNDISCYGIICKKNKYCKFTNLHINGIAGTQFYIRESERILSNNIRFTRTGYTSIGADCYSSNSTHLTFLNIISEREESEQSTAQVLYISQTVNSVTYVNNLRAKNVNAPIIDIRSGNAYIENVYGYNTGAIIIQTDTYSDSAKNYYMKNVILKESKQILSYKGCIFINAFENISLENISIEMSQQYSMNGILVKYYSYGNIGNVLMKNINIKGINLLKGIYIENVSCSIKIEHSSITNIISDHISVRDDNAKNPMINLNDVIIQGDKMSCVYDKTTNTYPHCFSKKARIVSGNSANRPINLCTYDRNQYYDSSISKEIRWNGYRWYDMLGFTPCKSKGLSSDRPLGQYNSSLMPNKIKGDSLPTNGKKYFIGFTFKLNNASGGYQPGYYVITAIETDGTITWTSENTVAGHTITDEGFSRAGGSRPSAQYIYDNLYNGFCYYDTKSSWFYRAQVSRTGSGTEASPYIYSVVWIPIVYFGSVLLPSDIGFGYYETDNNRMIYASAFDGDIITWVDAAGNVV